ncbi:glycosyl transferase [Roseibacterium sp. SDUM158016]|uniref:glycosyltransferase n=1 Tax=Roseicyclus sediminis TaxID=2980997 RepID=UPI0021CE277C|nr:glycosyltransferase [Roseibacterium sp. SDUM158016]MCU4654377.1 glycosyl transferase [Roseibacterium sp. SDUM158016]
MSRVVFFAFDIAEAAQIRRIESLRALGHEVSSVSFRRENMNSGFAPDWPDLPLGRSSNRRYLLRLGRMARALGTLWRHRSRLTASDVWIARNIDMALLAVAMRRLTGAREVRLVYECLDIHGLFTRGDALGAAMRWVERFVLKRCALLIVSSPGFLRAYFDPVQGNSTPVALIENKLWVAATALPRPQSPRRRAPGAPIRLGWVGTLRCARSLEILAGVADRLGDRVEIVCHGIVHDHAVPGFAEALAARPNMRHAGPYRYPGDLATVYAGCDAVWAQDLWQAGANSDWLLPNRIYEASYFGCPSIALAGTETGRRITEGGLGFAVEAPTAEALADLLMRLDADALAMASAALLGRPASDFRLTPEELAGHLSPVLPMPSEAEAIPAQ